MDWKGAGSAAVPRLDIDPKNKTKQNMHSLPWLLIFGSEDVRIKAAKEVRKLTKTSAKTRAYLATVGVILPLVSMLRSSCLKAKEAALLALLNLAVGNESNKLNIVKAGAIKPLIELLQSEIEKLRETAAATLYTLSAAPSNKPVISSSGAIPLLVDMLKSGSLQGKVDAVMALYNLSTSQENVIPNLGAEVVVPLLKLLKGCKKSSKIAEKSTYILESIASCEEGRAAIGNVPGGILALVEVLEDGSFQSRDYAVGILLALCESNRCMYKRAILEEGAIPGLLELTVQGSPRAQQRAHALLELLRDSAPKSSRESSLSMTFDNVLHITKGAKKGSQSPRAMLAEMVQLSMEQAMRHLQQRALVCVPLSS